MVAKGNGMRKIFKIITYMLLFTGILSAKLPTVSAKAVKKVIESGDDAKIILKATAFKNQIIEFPDIKNIAGYGIKESRSTQTAAAINYNGQKTDVIIKAKIYTFTPFKSVQIPSYTIKIDGKEYKTESFKITVAPKKVKKSNSDFIFKMKSSKKKVYIGEPFFVTVQLIEPVNASGANIEYTPPQFKGFEVSTLGDGKVTNLGDSVAKDITYQLLPKNSGKFIIKPAVAKIGLQVTAAQAQSPFSFFGADLEWITLKTNSVKIDVLEPPAADLIGNYRINVAVDKKETKINKPVTVTLTIEGEGILDNIDDPKIDIGNITVYSKDSNIEHRYENGKVYSIYSKKYVLIGNKDYTIPSITLTAFNYNNKKTYTLKSKPIDIKVKGSKSILSVLNSHNSRPEPQEELKKAKSVKKVVNKIENIVMDKEYYKRLYSNSGKYSLVSIVLALVFGLLVGILGTYYIPKYIKQKKLKSMDKKLYGSYEEALSILYPHIMEDDKIEEMVKILYEVTNGNSEIKVNEKALNKMIKKIKSSSKKVCK